MGRSFVPSRTARCSCLIRPETHTTPPLAYAPKLSNFPASKASLADAEAARTRMWHASSKNLVEGMRLQASRRFESTARMTLARARAVTSSFSRVRELFTMRPTVAPSLVPSAVARRSALIGFPTVSVGRERSSDSGSIIAKSTVPVVLHSSIGTLARANSCSSVIGHCVLGWLRNSGPFCQIDPSPRSLGPTDPPVSKSAGFKSPWNAEDQV